MSDIAAAYDLAAKWHDKNALGCRDIADDYMRVGADVAKKAKEAAKHHAASAAGLRLAAIEIRRRRLLDDEFESGNAAWAASFAN